MADRQTPSLLISPTEEPILAEIVRRLVEVYQPERIYLFGSVARGNAGPDSDYDIMLIVPDETPESLRRGNRAFRALRGIKAPIDVLIWRRQDFDEQLHLKASFPSTIVREGRLVYAA